MKRLSRSQRFLHKGGERPRLNIFKAINKLLGGGESKPQVTTQEPPEYIQRAQKNVISGAENLALGTRPPAGPIYEGRRVSPFPMWGVGQGGGGGDSSGMFRVNTPSVAPAHPPQGGPSAVGPVSSMNAPINVQQQAGMDMTQALALNYPSIFGATAMTPALHTLNRFQDPAMLNPMANPAFQGALDAAIRPQIQTFNETIMPSIRRNALMSGQYGGSRQGIAEGLAARGLTTSIGDIVARMSADQYNQAAGRQLQAAGMAPIFTGMQLQAAERPAQLMTGLGGYRQQLEQPFYQEPWQRLSWLSQFSGGSPGMTTTAPGPTSNPLLSVGGGAMAGLGLAGQIGLPATMAAMGPFAAGGALLGLLAS